MSSRSFFWADFGFLMAGFSEARSASDAAALEAFASLDALDLPLGGGSNAGSPSSARSLLSCSLGVPSVSSCHFSPCEGGVKAVPLVTERI